MPRLVLLLTFTASALAAHAQPTSLFSYQGLLSDAGTPANGTYHFQFELWTASIAGTQIGATLERDDVPVNDGRFSARLDFGASAFDGADRYLEVLACQGTCAGRGDFTSLGRTQLLAAPYAVTAQQVLTGEGHDHLGQTWTGTGVGDTPLQITGSFADGAVAGAALLVSNTDTGFSAGLRVEAAGTGVEIGTARNNGLVVSSAESRGISIVSTGDDGMRVSSAGDDGVEIGTAGRHGFYVQSVGVDGVFVDFAGDDGISVQQAVDDGVVVNNAGGNGLMVNNADENGVHIVAAATSGLLVETAGIYGVRVNNADVVGVSVGTAQVGLSVTDASLYGVQISSTSGDGVIVGSATGDGIQVTSTLSNGLYVDSALNDGVRIDAAGGDGVLVSSAGNSGFEVTAAAGYGLLANGQAGGAYIRNQISNSTTYRPDLVLGQTGLGDVNNSDAGILTSDPSYYNSDLQFWSNDDVTFFIDKDNNDLTSNFEIYGGLGPPVFTMDSVGDVFILGELTQAGGFSVIDHPLDPQNQTLRHATITSPDMMNVYNGNVTLGLDGSAVVDLPDYFETLNRDFRYQLTPVGAPGPNLYIAERVQEGRFRIAGGMPGLEVSWQVTGIRQDAWAEENRIVVEQAKRPEQMGQYLHPSAFGLSRERGVDYNAEEEARMDEERAQMEAERARTAGADRPVPTARREE